MPLTWFGRRTWRLRWWATVAGCAGIAVTFALGHWQLARARHKEALQARVSALAREPAVQLAPHHAAARDVLLRTVQARGRYEPKYMIYIDNRIHEHVAGYHVVMPLRLTATDTHVLVNRGWVAARRDRIRPPDVSTPEGEVDVRGLAVDPGERFLELSTRIADGNVWQNLVLERFRQATKLDILPLVIQQEGDAGDGLVRAWHAPDLGRNTHLAYAFQWFAMSAAIFIYLLVTGVRRKSAAG